MYVRVKNWKLCMHAKGYSGFQTRLAEGAHQPLNIELPSKIFTYIIAIRNKMFNKLFIPQIT